MKDLSVDIEYANKQTLQKGVQHRALVKANLRF